MKLLLKFILIGLPTIFLSTNCTIETVDDDAVTGTEISDNPAIGSVAAGEDFVLKSALVENNDLFGDAGYDFKLFSTDQACVDGAIPGIAREIDFFVKSDTPLETKEYDGLGPFIGSSSFFGCAVIITAVTETTISGKVKGGDPDAGERWVEGAFTATLCN